VADMSTNKYMS